MFVNIHNLILQLFCYSLIESIKSSGSCIGKPESFCSEQVENSICNRLKNECFCKKGFVAIREEDRVTCKTLLSNLKCRVDSDCIHISRSTCHPGAGQCACPGNTIYSMEWHACRSRYYGEQNPFCMTCQQLNGICFKFDSGDNTTVSYRVADDFIGCACSHHRATSLIKYKRFSDLCRITLSDIGEYCDNNIYVCQSKHALCQSLDKGSKINRLCTCSSNRVAIYQTHLNYYECFLTLPSLKSHCMNCHSISGQCYDMNEDDVGDGCLCPKRFSTELSNSDFQLNQQLCGIDTVHEQCYDGYFSICYQPHMEPPYEHLSHSLETNVSIVTLMSKDDEKCRLRKINGHNKFCIRIDMLDPTLDCNARFYKLKHNKVFYHATLEVRLNRKYKQPEKDLIIAVQCISNQFQRLFRNETSKNKKAIAKPVIFPVLSLGLQVLDKFNKEVFSLVEGSEVKLDISLVDSQGNFRSMRVEKCFSSNHSSLVHEEKSNFGEQIIAQGCPIYNNGFYAAFKTYVSPGIHLQSDMFQVFRHGSLSSIFYKCIIKVCMDIGECDNAKCNSYEIDTNEYHAKNAKNNSRSMFYERWSHIEIQKLQGYKNTYPGTDNSICHHVVCLSASQTILIALLLLFLLIMVVILLIFYSRGRVSSFNRNKRLLNSNYASSSKNSNIESTKPENIVHFTQGTNEPLPLPRMSKCGNYVDTYFNLSPQIIRQPKNENNKIYSNISYDLQTNPYARQKSPKFIPTLEHHQRNSGLIDFQTDMSSSIPTEFMEPCYLSIGRPRTSMAGTLSHPNDNLISPCECGSRECEFHPFIVAANVT